MNIRPHKVVEEYTGKDGVRVVVEMFYSIPTVNVTAFDKDGNRIFGGAYRNRAGAMIAVGRRFGHVTFKGMTTEKEEWEPIQ